MADTLSKRSLSALLARVQRRRVRVRIAEGDAATSTVVSPQLSTANEPASPVHTARPSTARRAFSTNGRPFLCAFSRIKVISCAAQGAIHLARAVEENFEVLHRLPVSTHAEGVQAHLSHAVKVVLTCATDEQHTACASAMRQRHAPGRRTARDSRRSLPAAAGCDGTRAVLQFCCSAKLGASIT